MTQERAVAFRILAVCTGNVCRSPAAERLLAAALGPSVIVESAGTGAVVGAPIDPSMGALLRVDGVPIEGFSARQVTEDMVQQAELVLGMSREHRSWTVDLVPSSVRRSFTFLEFARIVESLDSVTVPRAATTGERLRSIVPLAARARSEVSSSAYRMDVPDPVGQSSDVFARAYADIATAVKQLSK